MIRPPLTALLLSAITCTLPAAEKAGAFIEPTDAGPDFAVQGEYSGENSAAQVIALGGDKFHILGWGGGLPGTPDAELKVKVDAKRQGDKIVFDESGWKGTIVGGELTGTNDEGRTWKLRKVERKSPTLGAKPPQGATVLFDGKDASAWENGKVDTRGFLQRGTKSKQRFGDMTLHIEFRTPFQPNARGQGRGNSGVYIQDRYECQVLDSFGLEGQNNECGGIYTIARPRINMCYPPLSWQTYDIDFEAPRFDQAGNKTKNAVITVKHNGVVIHDRVELPKATGGAGLKESPEPGPIQLQDHGDPVFFRNIWVLEKK